MSMHRREFLAASGAAALAGCANIATPSGNGDYRKLRVIDAHAHWYPQEFVTLMEKEGPANGAKMGKDAEGNAVVLSVNGGTQTSVMRRNMVDLDLMIKEMDARKVNMYALSMTNPMVYWAPPAFGLKLSQVYNDSLAAAHQQYPTRFLGLMTLPMQAPEFAVKEIERAAKLPGIKGVYIATAINGRNLDDKAFWPVYERCEAMNLPLLLHPINPVGAERMKSYYLRNFIGNPVDTGIAAASLIFGGVMDAFPKLDVVLPHAGGITPILIGRWDHGSSVRPETKHMTKAPSTYLRRFHYDTISHSPQIMANIVKQVGADRVVLGSDHPADMSLERPVDFVESIPELSRSERELILGGNAQRLFRL